MELENVLRSKRLGTPVLHIFVALISFNIKEKWEAKEAKIKRKKTTAKLQLYDHLFCHL